MRQNYPLSLNRKRTIIWILLLGLLALAPQLIYASTPTGQTVKAKSTKPLDWKECARWKHRMQPSPHWLEDSPDGVRLKNTEYISEAFAALDRAPVPPKEYNAAIQSVNQKLKENTKTTDFRDLWEERGRLNSFSCQPFVVMNIFHALANEEATKSIDTYRVRFAQEFRAMALAWLGNSPTMLDIAVIFSIGSTALEEEIISGVSVDEWNKLRSELEAGMVALRSNVGKLAGNKVDRVLMQIVLDEYNILDNIKAKALPLVAGIVPAR